jgi:hypothetical protein
VQTNIVRVNGTRGALMVVMRNGGLHAGGGERNQGGAAEDSGRPDRRSCSAAVGDQSVFVRAAIKGVVREAVIAACLTGLMILLFLGSWRSTVIVCISIPLSILVSLIVLSAGPDHQRDDAGRPGAGGRHPGGRRHGRNRKHAPQHGDEEAAGARGARWRAADRGAGLRFHALYLHRVRAGAAAHRRGRYLFTPLAMAVVFAMLASYLLSRTLIPEHGALHAPAGNEALHSQGQHGETAGGTGPIWRRTTRSTGSLSGCAEASYVSLLDWCLEHRAAVLAGFLALSRGGVARAGHFIGRDFFPTVDSGQLRLHARAPVGNAHRADRGDLQIRSKTRSGA